MLVVLDEAAEQALLRSALGQASPAPVVLPDFEASLNLGEDLIVLAQEGRAPSYASAVTGVPLPCYGRLGPLDTEPSYPLPGSESEGPRRLLLEVSPGDPPQWRFVYFSSQSAAGRVCGVEVVHPARGAPPGTPGVSQRWLLGQKIVSVIGVGRRGSRGALELVRAGVESLHLADFARLRGDDVSGHLCGLADVGRFRTRAVRDAILRHNPRASAVCHQVDITENAGLLDQMLQSSDLAFVATGSEESRQVINGACMALAKPAVYSARRLDGSGGAVIRVVPGETGCYQCIEGGLADAFPPGDGPGNGPEEAEEAGRPRDWSDAAIASTQVMAALHALLKDAADRAPPWRDAEANVLIWNGWNGLAPAGEDRPLPQPMSWSETSVTRDPDCEVCGGVAGSSPG
jgi:hypothetical protein